MSTTASRSHEAVHFFLEAAPEHDPVQAKAFWRLGGKDGLGLCVLVQVQKGLSVHLPRLDAVGGELAALEESDHLLHAPGLDMIVLRDFRGGTGAD